MSVNGDVDPSPFTTVVVAVKSCRGSGSRRAVRWAVEKLVPDADRFVLVHVMRAITSIPTPSGNHIPIEELDPNVVAMYVQDVKAKFEEMFKPFQELCKTRKMEIVVLEGDNPAFALLRFASDSGITSLVLGSWSSNFIKRKLKGNGVPSVVLKHARQTCDIYVVCKRRQIKNTSNTFSTSESGSRHWLLTMRKRGSRGISKILFGCYASSVEHKIQNTVRSPSDSAVSFPNSQAIPDESVPFLSNAVQGIYSSSKVTYSEQSDLLGEVEQLRLELQNAIVMYDRACEQLVHAQTKVNLLSSECLEEARRVTDALRREEEFRKIAAEAKEKHLQAAKEVDIARSILAKEAYEKKIAELKTLKEALEKQDVVDTLFLGDRRYKRYTREEIEVATDCFSEAKVIGEGAYGKVYKCSLDHVQVAVKVRRSDASAKKEEFLREVEVLSQLHHPNVVLLLGACPDNGCLVYEYMENGSLEDHIFHHDSNAPLSWSIRFRIAFEVACGLAFLHNSKPEIIVHRDLKPGNILLDKNYVSKIGDVGMAKLISEAVPDDVTEYRESILAGTLFYMDPEYQRTGTVRPKSDLYAFGIIILQLLAARRPNGLLVRVENAIASGSLSNVLDKSITDWPLAEAEDLARIALKCAALRCRDRPDLETEVLPVLRKLADFADARMKAESNSIHAPGHYYCPILQEVMEDPHIAGDGFSYEYRAIKLWLERHEVSPVTKLKLEHKMLTPNHTLRSAIQEWKSRVASLES